MRHDREGREDLRRLVVSDLGEARDLKQLVNSDIESREQLRGLVKNDIEARKSRIMTEKRTWIGILSSFFAMLAIYFFTEYDLVTHLTSGNTLEGSTYMIAGILELIAMGFCLSGLLATSKEISDVPGKDQKQKKGLGFYSNITSIVLTVGVVIGFVIVITILR